MKPRCLMDINVAICKKSGGRATDHSKWQLCQISPTNSMHIVTPTQCTESNLGFLPSGDSLCNILQSTHFKLQRWNLWSTVKSSQVKANWRISIFLPSSTLPDWLSNTTSDPDLVPIGHAPVAGASQETPNSDAAVAAAVVFSTGRVDRVMKVVEARGYFGAAGSLEIHVREGPVTGGQGFSYIQSCSRLPSFLLLFFYSMRNVFFFSYNGKRQRKLGMAIMFRSWKFN